MELEIGSQVVDPVVEDLEEDEFEGIEGKMNAMLKVKEVMFRKAKNNVLSAQERYKKDYNKKRKLERVRFLFLLQLLSIFTIFIIRNMKLDQVWCYVIQGVTAGKEIKWFLNGWVHMRLLI